MKIFIIESHHLSSVYIHTILYGNTSKKLKDLAKEFTAANPKLTISQWSSVFVQWLIKKYKMKTIEPECTSPQSNGIDYCTP